MLCEDDEEEEEDDDDSKKSTINEMKQSIKLVSYGGERLMYITADNNTEHIVIAATSHSLEIYFVIDLPIFCHSKSFWLCPKNETKLFPS